MILNALLMFAYFGVARSAQCSNVYPQLSCGLSYVTEQTCTSAGCCWDDTSLTPCFVPSTTGYDFKDTTNSTDTVTMTGILTRATTNDLFNKDDFLELSVSIVQEAQLRTHITIQPTNSERWTVPESLLPRPGGLYDPNDPSYAGAPHSKAEVTSDPFNIQVTRSSSGSNPYGRNDVIFNLTNDIIFQDQYIQFVLKTPSTIVATYGFGESTRDTQQLQEGSIYTLWNSDTPAASFDQSLYGSHPFFIQVTDKGKAQGVFFMNSNAMELTVSGSDTEGQTLGIQTTGGIIDIYVFAGPTPVEVVRQYLDVIGKPAFVPFWSLGFHNCRWGYPNISNVAEVVANYSAFDIPLEAQWLDIDYMKAYLDFTVDPINFPLSDMQSFVSQLHSNNQRFVPIIDPAIYVLDNTYEAYTTGVADEVFVKDYTGTKEYLGQVWPGPTYFPDWFAPNTDNWWKTQLQDFFNMIPYDGLWIDMNEVSNFCNGNGTAQVCDLNPNAECGGTVCCLSCEIADSQNKYDFPPFTPHVSKGSLGGNTLAMSTVHSGNVIEYNSHALYGFMESISTHSAVVAITGKRPFILSRSTFPGSGMYAAHWTGDNTASWEYLRASIISMNNMALFGVPMVGADICGFFNTTTEELCARWIEVGAFSPFSRDHSNKSSPAHPLYKWESVAQASRSALGLRYRLLPHLYTLMYNAHKYGNTVHNALWMHFPGDRNTLTADTQYMWSGGLLFTPVVTLGADSVTGYFPQSMWYSLTDNSAIDHSFGGGYVEIPTSLTQTNVHMRAGHIIPMQESGMTTSEVHSSEFTLLVALSKYGISGGSLYIDDGEQNELNEFIHVEYYTNRDSSLTSIVVNNSYVLPTAVIKSFELYGVDSTADQCTSSLTILIDDVPSETITPSSVTLSKYSTYSKLVVSFSDSSAVNVATNFVLSWSCSSTQDDDTPATDDADDAVPSDDTPPSDDDSADDVDTSSDSSETGWNDLPAYGQALIIITIILGAIGFIGIGVYFWKLKQKKKDALLSSLL